MKSLEGDENDAEAKPGIRGSKSAAQSTGCDPVARFDLLSTKDDTSGGSYGDDSSRDL
jgi:hypothetical protein